MYPPLCLVWGKSKIWAGKASTSDRWVLGRWIRLNARRRCWGGISAQLLGMWVGQIVWHILQRKRRRHWWHFLCRFSGKDSQEIIRRKSLEKYSGYFPRIIPRHFLRKTRKKPDGQKIKFYCVFVISFEVQINWNFSGKKINMTAFIFGRITDFYP